MSLGEWIIMLFRIWEGQTVQELLDPPTFHWHTKNHYSTLRTPSRAVWV